MIPLSRVVDLMNLELLQEREASLAVVAAVHDANVRLVQLLWFRLRLPLAVLKILFLVVSDDLDVAFGSRLEEGAVLLLQLPLH